MNEINIELTGKSKAIEALSAEIQTKEGIELQVVPTKHASGGAAMVTAIAALATSILPWLLEIVRYHAPKDRDLTISVNGITITARDLDEVDAILEMLAARGVVLQEAGSNNEE